MGSFHWQEIIMIIKLALQPAPGEVISPVVTLWTLRHSAAQISLVHYDRYLVNLQGIRLSFRLRILTNTYRNLFLQFLLCHRLDVT